MRFASLGSGSKGNATLVEVDDTCVLVDCGFSMRETIKRLHDLQRTPQQLSAIVVTHEHGDHIKGVLPLARKYQLPVYMTAGTAKAAGAKSTAAELPEIHIISDGNCFQLGALQVQPVAVPHDAREPVQFLFRSTNHCLGILTDIGTITPYVVQSYQYCDGLLLESNHDLQMLASGPYSQSLKRRVSSNWGHLNNLQSADLLSQVERSKLQHLVLGHISLQNNSIERVQQSVEPLLDEVAAVHYACQQQGFDWLQLN